MTEQRFNTDYLSLADTLYRIAFFILESQAEAEDAVQEAYLKLWEKRDALDGVQNPKGFAVRMVRNICTDRIRRASRLCFPENLPESAAPQTPAEETMDARKRLDNVLEAVKALPERHRRILILRTVEGLPYDEISRRTGMNELTCRVLLSQARSKIKTI